MSCVSLGVDANGLYITTNEFELLSPGRFRGAQIYAISKRGLVAGGPANVELFDTAGLAPTTATATRATAKAGWSPANTTRAASRVLCTTAPSRF